MSNLANHHLSIGDHYDVINNNILHYKVSGNGPVCLFPTPGWGPSIELYTTSLQPLEKYFTIVWFDTRMSGLSSGPEDPLQYSSKDFIEDLEALRIFLGLENMWLMGQSAGAYQVLNYAILNDKRVNGIVAISSTAGRDSISAQAFMKNIERLEQNPELEPGTRIFSGKDTHAYTLMETIDKILPLYFHDQQKIADFTLLTANTTYSQKAFDFTNASRNGSELLFPMLNQITVPTLLIVGDNDFICDQQSQSDRIHELIPSSTLLVIRNAGHFCWIEQPEQFFFVTEKWLASKLDT